MKDWYIIPEIVGCNATLRIAAMRAVDAVEQGRHFVVEGEPGSGRRLLARSAWCRRSPGARSLFTLDCRMFQSDGAEVFLFGGRSCGSSPTILHPDKLNQAAGGGLLLLHAEFLPIKTQSRLAQALGQSLLHPPRESVQLMMTCPLPMDELLPLHPDLDGLLLRVRVPALRERVEDIRAIAESFLRNASPFERIRCSQALIDRFCGYDWPGNVTELRSVLRHLLLEPHNGLLDVRHLTDLMCRDETCFALLQGGHRPSHIEPAFLHRLSSSESRSMQ
jgi:DNA-binding NtrC family response regulator